MSEGTIELAGISSEMRRGTHSITNVSASLLVGLGDCRETLYAVGALYATQQKMHTQSLVNDGLKALDEKNTAGFENLLTGEIAAATRYQLRGQHASVYVEGIAMNKKYASVMSTEDPSLAMERVYSIQEFKAGKPLTQYELEYALIRVTYTDGSRVLLRPQDPKTKKWRAHPAENGRPIIPNQENLADIHILNFVEEHTLSHLYDTKEHTAELADAFYDNERHNGPYSFGSGSFDFPETEKGTGLVSAGTRTLKTEGGETVEAPVHLESLGYSKTDYAPSLGEADIPNAFRLMGRMFNANIVEEFKKIGRNESNFSKAMDRIYAWKKAVKAPALHS